MNFQIQGHVNSVSQSPIRCKFLPLRKSFTSKSIYIFKLLGKDNSNDKKVMSEKNSNSNHSDYLHFLQFLLLCYTSLAWHLCTSFKVQFLNVDLCFNIGIKETSEKIPE
jgi:hypothetical protein